MITVCNFPQIIENLHKTDTLHRHAHVCVCVPVRLLLVWAKILLRVILARV